MGMRVAVLDINPDSAARVEQQIRGKGGEAMALPAAVEDRVQIDRAFALMDERWGGVDVLINNAGVSGNKATLELTAEDWRRVMDVNLNGVFHCSQEAGRRMVPRKSGCIVNVGSIYSVVAAPNRLTYCASKAAVAMMTKSLAIEWAASGVRVNAVACGYIDTDMTTALVKAGLFDVHAVAKRTPLGRLGTPEEIAHAVHYLVSDEAAYVTGHVLGVDGGWAAYGYI
jgi:NAD(P)-dependent dehydrogenase (short-subunit alcohol dehydrogenase family)